MQQTSKKSDPRKGLQSGVTRTQARVSKKPSARLAYGIVAALVVLLWGFSLTFFQNKKVSAPVHAKIIRQRIIKQAVHHKKKDESLVHDKSSALVTPSQTGAQDAGIEKGVEKQNKGEAFVSIDRLVPKEIFSYEASIPKRADLNRTEGSGKKTGPAIVATLTEKVQDFGKKKLEYNRLDKVKTNETAGEFSLALLTARAIEGYDSFLLKAPPRFVIDFSGTWRIPKDSELKVQGQIARSVRFGKHSDHLRVVIDLTAGEFEVPTIKETSKGLVVTIRKASNIQKEGTHQ
jgi:hypothetical protein